MSIDSIESELNTFQRAIRVTGQSSKTNKKCHHICPNIANNKKEGTFSKSFHKTTGASLAMSLM